MYEEIETIVVKYFEDSDGALASLECQEDEVDTFSVHDAEEFTTDILEVESLTLFKGDLTADFIDQQNVHSLLIVLGNLKVKRGLSVSQVCVLGDLEVEHDFVFDSMSEHDLYVGGDYRGGRIWLFDHEIQIEGNTEGEIFEDASKLLPEYFEDGLPSPELISEGLKKGENIHKP